MTLLRSIAAAVRRPRARRGERGVTLVEYVLFAGCFILVAVTAVGSLNSMARNYFQTAGSRIGQPVNRLKYDSNGQRPQQAVTTTITVPTPTTTSPATTTTRATTTLPPTTTTTAPPTTIAPTTTRATTTVAPTTTAAPTTTIARRVSTALANTSFNTANNDWTFRVVVTVSGVGGASVNGLTVSASGRYGGAVVGSGSCTTNTSGVCTVTYPGVPDAYSPIVFQITAVSGTAPWTGSTASLTVNAP